MTQKLASYLGLNWYSLSDEGPCHSDELFVQFKFHVVPFDCRYLKKILLHNVFFFG